LTILVSGSGLVALALPKLFHSLIAHNFCCIGKPVELHEAAEEIMTHYARMLDHDYTSKEIFNKDFMHDWRKSMTLHERELITDLTKCDFREVHAYFKKQSEEKKNLPKEEKDKLKAERKRIIEEYGFATLDGYK
jgi:DNA topoisomerase-1